jgi:hypothetical protein
MPLFGLNADAQFLGDVGAFYEFAHQLDAVHLIDDDYRNRKWEHSRELRRRNSSMALYVRRYFKDAEGDWFNVMNGDVKTSPQRLFDIITDGYDPSLNLILRAGCEPAHHGDALRYDIDRWCEFIEIAARNKVKVAILGQQFEVYEVEEMPLFAPLFMQLHKHKAYAELMVHCYFGSTLYAGVRPEDAMKMLSRGAFDPPYTPPTAVDMFVHRNKMYLGRYLMPYQYAKERGWDIRISADEFGFDRIRLPFLAQLDGINGGREISGIQTLETITARNHPGNFEDEIADQIEAVLSVMPHLEHVMFYGWSNQGEWKNWNIQPYKRLQARMLAFNARLRAGTPPPVEPPPPTPPAPNINDRIAAIEARLTALESWRANHESD